MKKYLLIFACTATILFCTNTLMAETPKTPNIAPIALKNKKPLSELPPPSEWTESDATKYMAHYPEESAKILKKIGTPSSKLTLALLLHYFTPETVERNKKINAILEGIATDLNLKAQENKRNGMRIKTYEGSSKVFTAYMMNMSLAQKGSFWGEYLIPCAVVAQDPLFIELSIDGCDPYIKTLRNSCNANTDVPIAYMNYYKKVQEHVYDDLFGKNSGSIRRCRRQLLNYKIAKAQFNPEALLKKTVPNHLPYEAWSYACLDNWKIFEPVREHYSPAFKSMVNYYKSYFSFSDIDADKAAKAAMFIPVYEGKLYARHTKLRSYILNNKPINKIKDLLEDNDIKDLQYYGATSHFVKIDPLMLVTVERPEVTKVLLEKDNADWNINIRNDFGKTPLMAAAQFDALETVKILLDAGAQIDARTNKGNLSPYSGEIKHGERTALMYAAANASRPLIEYLIDAGADLKLKDTVGLTAIDYLQGKGPTGTNPKLNGNDVKELADGMAK
jgi:hypothetical protein